MNKRLCSTILMLSSTICGLAQSLSIPETVDYLNKILVQTPHREKIRPLKLYTETNYSYSDANRLERIRVISDSNRHVYVGCDVVTTLKCLIDKEGFLTFQTFVTTTNCDDSKNNVNNELRETYKINVDEIDMEKIRWYLPKNDKSWMIELNDNINDCGAISLECVDKDVKCIYFESKYGEYNWDNLQLQSKFKKADYTIGIYSEDFKYDIKRFYNALVYLIYSAKEQGYRRQRNDLNDPFVNQPNNTKTGSGNTAKKEYKAQLKSSNGVFSLSVNINGKNYEFILDSGAGECNISSTTEQLLLSSGIIKQNNYLKNGLYKLADGSIVECKRVMIPKISVAGKTVYNVTASIGPSDSPNLLGQSFLNKTSQWTINNSEKCLVLH